MDAISILSLIQVCAGITLQAGKLAVCLKSLASKYKHIELTISVLSNQCKLFAIAVSAIQRWMCDGPEREALDDTVWTQLDDSLACANDIVAALDIEIAPFVVSELSSSTSLKSKAVWNLQSLSDHEERMRSQISGLTLLLQIMQLPSTPKQRKIIEEKASVETFERSRDSVSSIYGDKHSERCSTITTEFDFDAQLLSSGVYQRHVLVMRSRDTLRSANSMEGGRPGNGSNDARAIASTVQDSPEAEEIAGVSSTFVQSQSSAKDENLSQGVTTYKQSSLEWNRNTMQELGDAAREDTEARVVTAASRSRIGPSPVMVQDEKWHSNVRRPMHTPNPMLPSSADAVHLSPATLTDWHRDVKAESKSQEEPLKTLQDKDVAGAAEMIVIEADHDTRDNADTVTIGPPRMLNEINEFETPQSAKGEPVMCGRVLSAASPVPGDEDKSNDSPAELEATGLEKARDNLEKVGDVVKQSSPWKKGSAANTYDEPEEEEETKLTTNPFSKGPAKKPTNTKVAEPTDTNTAHAIKVPRDKELRSDFDIWQSLSSHWEVLVAYWVRRLQQNTNEMGSKPNDQELVKQIGDLNAAGANLFHAVVQLQRLRASSERKFRRWFSETKAEQERAQEIRAQLQRQIEIVQRQLEIERQAHRTPSSRSPEDWSGNMSGTLVQTDTAKLSPLRTPARLMSVEDSTRDPFSKEALISPGPGSCSKSGTFNCSRPSKAQRQENREPKPNDVSP